MFKPWQTRCLAGAGLLVLAAFLYADGPNENAVALQQAKKKAAPTNPDQAAAAKDAGWIGLMFDEKDGKTVQVKDVFPGGPAAFAGVRVGDVLEEVGNTKIDSVATAAKAIEGLSPKQQTVLTLQRGDKKVQVKVLIESLAEFHGRYVREMMRRDPRDPKYGERHGVSQADMQVELIRRLFEQNQRLEEKVTTLAEEVHALRKELRGPKK